jgi:hypothetical protein
MNWGITLWKEQPGERKGGTKGEGKAERQTKQMRQAPPGAVEAVVMRMCDIDGGGGGKPCEGHWDQKSATDGSHPCSQQGPCRCTRQCTAGESSPQSAGPKARFHQKPAWMRGQRPGRSRAHDLCAAEHRHDVICMQRRIHGHLGSALTNGPLTTAWATSRCITGREEEACGSRHPVDPISCQELSTQS